jgi:hypothetical protein
MKHPKPSVRLVTHRDEAGNVIKPDRKTREAVEALMTQAALALTEASNVFRRELASRTWEGRVVRVILADAKAQRLGVSRILFSPGDVGILPTARHKTHWVRWYYCTARAAPEKVSSPGGQMTRAEPCLPSG